MFNSSGKFVEEKPGNIEMKLIQKNLRLLDSTFSSIIFNETKFLVSKLPEDQRGDLNKTLNTYLEVKR